MFFKFFQFSEINLKNSEILFCSPIEGRNHSEKSQSSLLVLSSPKSDLAMGEMSRQYNDDDDHADHNVGDDNDQPRRLRAVGKIDEQTMPMVKDIELQNDKF